ncbi:MAG: methyl-accepting chemotaxis protein [Burkholderiales bacterium]|nr:methyl-accepting chemotaxis protein [Burkholderiales bacterium]
MSTRHPNYDAGFGSFFRYHGWLAPGVKLFRSISFPAKAAWISIMLVIPLALLVWLFWQQTSDQINITQSEQQGIAYVTPITEYIAAAQNLRRSATAKSADMAEMQTKANAAFEKVVAQQKLFTASATGSNNRFQALSKVHSAIAQAPVAATLEETFAAHSAVIHEALRLISDVADDAQLSLDPELESYHVMNVGVLLGPKYSEQLARLRGLGYAAMASKEPLAPKISELLHENMALIEFIDEQVENSYRLGVEDFPEVAKTFDMKGVDDSRGALLKAIETDILGESIKGDPAAFLAMATTAVDKQRAIDLQLRERLNGMLDARLSRLKRAFFSELGICLLSIALAVYLMLAFYKVMMGGLQEVSGHLTEITKGNLTTAPKPWGTDEVAQLMLTMGAMQLSLRKIASSVREGAGSVQTASDEIASASLDLSQRTESNAASLEKTAASMEQITATVKHTADSVQGATSIVRENAASATRGGEVISQVVKTMDGIRTSSNQIGEIIGVIDGIAFQTNILALNAAVEAARAGEQGRGFAVVASEVRSLAGRSAAAAKEIKTLISASIEQVEVGTRVVAEAGTTIGEIVANAGKIDTLMGEIATATREQTQGVAEVATAVQDLDQSTQQNAALVEQTASAASSLAEQAQRLTDDVAFFKFK